MTALASLEAELEVIRHQGLHRSMCVMQSSPGAECVIGGERLLNFSSNDYLGLASDPRLLAAAQDAVRKYGAGSGASRLICGNLEPHDALEAEIAQFKGGARSVKGLLFNSGYHANIGVISALAQADDAIFSDELNHASIIDGCRLSRARTVIYRHADADDLACKLAANAGARRKLIVTDSVFSMDGDRAPLGAIVEIAERWDAWVMIDEAHAVGVLGSHGRGLAHDLGLSHKIHLQMGTLGKALGSFGAYVVAPSPFIELLINRARSFIFTTGLPPAPVASAREALRILQTDTEPLARLRDNIVHFAAGLRHLEISTSGDGDTPIFPVLIGDERRTMSVMRRLRARGIFAVGVRPPTVPSGTSRLRLTVTAAHSRSMLERALDELRHTLASVGAHS
jgi:8-amino-7-oxononanoate synthase